MDLTEEMVKLAEREGLTLEEVFRAGQEPRRRQVQWLRTRLPNSRQQSPTNLGLILTVADKTVPERSIFA